LNFPWSSFGIGAAIYSILDTIILHGNEKGNMAMEDKVSLVQKP